MAAFDHVIASGFGLGQLFQIGQHFGHFADMFELAVFIDQHGDRHGQNREGFHVPAAIHGGYMSPFAVFFIVPEWYQRIKRANHGLAGRLD